MKTREVSSIVYSASYIVVDPGTVDELERTKSLLNKNMVAIVKLMVHVVLEL